MMSTRKQEITMRTLKYMRGITLMELMIVVVIVGILVTVGYPNYREFAARAKRTEARALLLEIATNQERFYLNNNRFGTMGELAYAADPMITDSGSYSVTVTQNDASNFSATATYILTGPEAAKCTTFTINGRGDKTSTGSTADCWSATR